MFLLEAMKQLKDLRRRLRTSAKLATEGTRKQKLRERDAWALNILIEETTVHPSTYLRLAKIAQIIESVDNRCLAHDGPVGSTMLEMTQDEMSEIYRLAKGGPQ